MTAVSEHTLVSLLDGFTVAMEVLELAWNLEDRGLNMNVLDGGVLEVLPVERLQPADAVAIRKHKAELIALCRYVARDVGAERTCPRLQGTDVRPVTLKPRT